MSKQLIDRRLSIGAVVLAFAIALTGCSTGSIVQKSYEGFPVGAPSGTEAPAAFANSTTLFLVLAGSSTCPPTPTAKTETNGSLEIAVTVKDDGPCTMDLITTTHEIALTNAPKEIVIVTNGKNRQTIPVKTL